MSKLNTVKPRNNGCIGTNQFHLLLVDFPYDKEHTICTVTATNDPSFETVCAWNFFIFK